MNDFSPKSRAQTEREIVRTQKDFSSGMFNDIPATAIPENGVAYLKNFVNKGNELIGRSGSKRWGNYATQTPSSELPSIATGIHAISEVSGSIRTITILQHDEEPYSFTSGNLSDFFVHDNGIHERILSVVSSTIITTETESSDSYTSTNAWVRKQLNGLYFHKFLHKVVMHLGEDLYVSNDMSFTGWTRAYCESFYRLADEISTIEEKDNYVLVFNRNGIYRLDLDINSNSSYFYYKINSQIPIDKLITPEVIPDQSNFARRYIYGLGKLSGTGQNRTRQTSGVTQLIDSGTNKLNDKYIDWAEYWKFKTRAEDRGIIIEELTVPVIDDTVFKDEHWNVYTIWGTTDTSPNGIDPETGSGTNTEQYIWIADVPIMKTMKINVSGSICTILQGEISEYDIGSVVYIHNGTSFESKTISNVNILDNIFYIDTDISVNTSNATSFLGAEKGAMFEYSTSGTDYKLTVTTGNSLTNIDKDKKIFLSSGDIVHIKEVINGVVYLADPLSLSSNSVCGCWNVTSRKFYDSIEDDTLRSRISGYPCYQRFYEGLPNANIGVVSSGFVFTSMRNNNYIYYSQLSDGYDYLAGYHHPAYQMTLVKDGIRAMKALKTKVIIYCYSSTSAIETSTYSEITMEELGVSVAILTSQSPIDDNIGVVAYGSIQSLENGNHIVITNEPAIRILNGDTYSSNLASKKIMNILKTFQPNMSSNYNPLTGYIFWGSV